MTRPRITRLPPVTATSWQAAVDSLSRAINTALSDISDALEGKGGAPERAFVDDVFDADAGFPRFLPNPLHARPLGLVVAFAECLTDGSAFASAVFPTWDMSDGRLAVRGLTGLTPGKRYRIRYEVSA